MKRRLKLALSLAVIAAALALGNAACSYLLNPTDLSNSLIWNSLAGFVAAYLILWFIVIGYNVIRQDRAEPPTPPPPE